MNELLAKQIFKLGATIRNPGLLQETVGLEKTDFCTQAEFETIQNKKLSALFTFLKVYNPFYAGLIPANFENNPKLALQELPVIDKTFLLGNMDKLTNYLKLKNLITAETSGSTGQPFKFKKNRAWDTANRASFIRGYHWYGIEPWQRNGYFWGYNLNPKQKLKTILLDNLQNRFRVFSYEKEDLKHFLKKLKSARYLHGYSSMIFEVAKIAVELGFSPKDFPKLSMIKGTSEKIFDYYHEPVLKAFGHKIISEYGSAEAGLIAYECPNGKMHINEENVILEVIAGQAVATNLNAFSLPIIRYKVGDAITINQNAICACGRKSAVIEEITGRVGKKIIGYKSTYPSLTLYYIFKNISLQKGADIQYQAVQMQQGAMDLRIPRTLSLNERNWIQVECIKYFADDVTVEILENTSIHDKKGKLKDFISDID